MTWVHIDFKVKRLNAVDKISDKSTKMSTPSPLVHCLKFLYVLRRDTVNARTAGTSQISSTLPLEQIQFLSNTLNFTPTQSPNQTNEIYFC